MSAPLRSRGRRRGFSLLEVTVAVGLFAVFMTVILAAQGDGVRSNRIAQNIGTAITVGRCRMTEIEEKLLKLGYPEIDEIDSNTTCCDEKEVPGFRCEWRVEKVVMPNPPNNSILGDAGAALNLATLGSGEGGAGVPGVINNAAGGPGLDFDAGLQGIGGALQQQIGGVGGAQGMLTMVFSIVYPSLKILLENSIRRLTVVIKWKEGPKERDFTLVQYVTNPARSGFMSGALPTDGGVVGDGGVAPTPPPGPGGPGLNPGFGGGAPPKIGP